MALHTIDWFIIGGYILFSLGVGIYFSRRAGSSTEEYFLSGRTLPWWIVGTSMVATTFAADTPLAITEFVRGSGIWQNWFWWNLLLSGLLGAILFSRLWRRAKVLTDNELLEIRYSGKPAAALRAFKAGYFAILYNFIVMGWVINAMASVAAVLLNIDRWTAVWICVAIALLYALLSGFWGVVVTDIVQFFIAMIGSILLAVIAVNAVGGMDMLLEKLSQLKSSGIVHDTTLKFIPPVPEADFFSISFWDSPFSKFLVFMTIMWWSHHGTDGGGYIIQRMSSAKNEKHALAATLWFNIAHYALRVWPWIAVALASMVVFPVIPDSYADLGSKAGYPLIMNEYLGSGLKGLLIVSFLAAFMSTIDTHLNWGASYLVNDIYKRFIKNDGSQHHYVLVSRIITVILMVCAAFVAINMQSISKAWEFIYAMGAGIGAVLILRWFWWRINAWTEISALLTSIVITIVLELIAWQQTILADIPYALFNRAPVLFGITLQVHHKLMIIVPAAIIVWICITFLTKPESERTLTTFYDRVQPGGWWGSFAIKSDMQPVTQGFFLNWIAGTALIYGLNFAIGNWLFGNGRYALSLLLISAIGFWWIWNNLLKKIDE
ncbi:MAG: Na+:solute symporter [Candidatus Marinimicrobia bacterium]|jgi:SSS family transporter|nr:Na+:solute symporter [Candidatus Neomarinimicrobiota bacterium]